MPKQLADCFVVPEDEEWFERKAARLAADSSKSTPLSIAAVDDRSIVREHGFFGRHSDERRRYAIYPHTL